MRRKEKAVPVDDLVQVAERLLPYVDAGTEGGNGLAAPGPPLLDELMERAVTLLTVMPRNQRRATIEELVAPYDPERGRRTVDALIDAELVTEDDAGILRRR